MVQRMRAKTLPFDPAYYLDSDEAVGAYLADALREDEPGQLRDALRTAFLACGIRAIAEAAGMSHMAMCEVLRSGHAQAVRRVAQAAADCLVDRAAD